MLRVFVLPVLRLRNIKSLPVLETSDDIASAEELLGLAYEQYLHGRDSMQRRAAASVMRVLLRTFMHGATEVGSRGMRIRARG